jgi:hypothetical protein
VLNGLKLKFVQVVYITNAKQDIGLTVANMERTYKCVTGEIVSMNDTIEYIYKREDIEPLFRDLFTLSYPRCPVMVNGIMFDAASISKWRFNNSYRDPVIRKSFELSDIVNIKALKFVLLCLEDTFDDTKVIYKTVINEDGTQKQVFDREATNELHMKAVVKFHAPPSNILHACRLVECLSGANQPIVDGKPATWIINKRVNDKVEIDNPDRVEVDGPIRTSAYAMNCSVLDVYSSVRDAVNAGCGAYGGSDFNCVNFSELPQGFRLIGCTLTNCNQFDHLTLIDCQVHCDYKCYPINYYATASLNSDDEMVPCNKLVYGNNFVVSKKVNNEQVVNSVIQDDRFKSIVVRDLKHDKAVINAPPVYESLRQVKYLNEIPEMPITPIINYQMRLQVGIWRDPILAGALSQEDMLNPDIKFERCFNLMTLINTKMIFKSGIRKFGDWLGAINPSNHHTVFKLGNYEVADRRRNLPKMVESDTWYDLSGLNMSNWKFQGCMFRDTTFAGANLNSSNFVNCTFDNVDFTMTALSGATFKDCKFVNIQPANGIEIGGVKYQGCNSVENIIEIVPGSIIIEKPINPDLPQPVTRIVTRTYDTSDDESDNSGILDDSDSD